MTDSISDIKKELRFLEPEKLIEVCLKLAKYKKENKELLAYLLFESGNETAFIEKIKTDMDAQFEYLHTYNSNLLKKGLRKILRITDKYIKFSGQKQTETELRIHFCHNIQRNQLPLERHPVLSNIYNRQLEKINKSILLLHEDLQYDFRKDLEKLARFELLY